jgi:micrococcal nuclease
MPRPSAVTACLLACLAVLAGCSGAVPTGEPTGDGAGTAVRVTDVVDGDTVRVVDDEGTEEVVRLLGVDTPEVRGDTDTSEYEGVPDTDRGRACLRTYGDHASAYAERRLADRRVRLVTDPTADRRGSFGRLLAYVVVDGEQFNYALVREGYARLYDTEFTERDRYATAEAEARTAGRGLWTCATGTAVPDGGSTDGPLAVDAHPDAAGNDNENLNDEYVTLRNVGDETLNLTGWSVSDATDKRYTFAPGTTLEPGASVTLYTGSGTDTESERYWGRTSAVWNNGGDTLTVRNETGGVVVTREV